MKSRATPIGLVWLSFIASGLVGCSVAELRNAKAADAALGGQISESLRALASGQARASESFEFALVGDSRAGLNVLRKELAKIDSENPDFVIYTGDLVKNGTESEYRAGIEAFKTIRAPVFPAIGNHERRNGGIRWYFELLGKDLDYSYDYHGYRFISLDNSPGNLNSGQIAWLQLKLQTPLRKIIFAHMPPPLGIWRVHPFVGNYKAFLGLIEAAKVDACLFGHIHIFDHTLRRGVRHIVSGGGGAPLYKLPFFNSKDGGAFYHHMRFQAGDDGLKYSVVRLHDVEPAYSDEPFEAVPGEPLEADTTPVGRI